MTISPTNDRVGLDQDPIDHREGVTLGHEAYRRFASVVDGIRADQWGLPTDCDGWTVRDLVGHMVGSMRAAASVRELLSQQREIAGRVKRDGGNETEVMTQVQIDRVADLAPDQLVTECLALVDKAATGRRRTPALMRRFVSFRVQMGSIDERWRLGYLIDVILTRDTWLHRIDLCRALGTDPVLTADHDGRIVADVVAEWARRHAQPFHLVLTGPAGGTFGSGSPDAAAREELDAVEFCRILSGRRAGTGLLATEVPF